MSGCAAKAWLCHVTLLLLACAAGCKKSPEDYARLGDEQYRQARYQDAILLYSNALKGSPGSSALHYKIGLSFQQVGEFAKAYDAMQAALQLDGKNLNAARDLLRFSLGALLSSSTSRPASLALQVTRLADRLLQEDANDFDALRAKAYVELTQSRPAFAVRFAEKALATKPMEPDVVLLLAEARSQIGEEDAAEKLVRELIAARPDHQPAYAWLYGRYMAARRSGEALRLLQAAVTANPKSTRARLELAGHYRVTGDLHAQESEITHILGRPADFQDGRPGVATYYVATGRSPEARPLLEACAQEPGAFQLSCNKSLLRWLADNGDREKALAESKQFLLNHPGDRDIGLLSALLSSASPDPDQRRTGVSELEKLATSYPLDLEIRLALAQAHATAGNEKAALADLKEAERLRPTDPGVRLQRASLAGGMGDYQSALASADAALLLSPGDPAALNMRAASLRALGRFQEARAELNKLDSALPDSAAVKAEQVQLKLMEGKPKEALAILRPLVTANPKAPRLQLLFIDALVSTRQARAALLQAQSAVEKNPKVLPLRVLLGELQLSNGAGEAGRATLTQVLAQAPEEPRALQLLALHYDMSGQKAEAERFYRRWLDQQPDQHVAQNNLAFLLLEKGARDEARSLAEKAVRNAPNEPEYADTLGLVQLKEQRVDDALRSFQNAVRMAPGNPMFRFHYGQALHARGQRELARAEMRKALDLNPPQAVAAQIRGSLESM